MRVESWHSGKLFLLWGLSLAVLAFLLFARPENCNDLAVALWLALIAPLARWTWNWAGAREDTPDEFSSEGYDGRDGKRQAKREAKKAVAIIFWIGVVVVLAWSYLACQAPSDIELF